ncbi:MAG: SUMF1/EgtB/PvdO family nonheme iron enzyme, partial [Deltaproteobacteria bacterium]|nr:SUMF1/EgtB/PvdO family nonheme iron enzyme [Deltaproteobacteria bacterium]
GTRESGGDYAAVSGETESAERPLPQRDVDEDLSLPRKARGAEQEARARNVLQAFDATEGTGRFEEMIEPAEEPSMDELLAPEEPPEALNMAMGAVAFPARPQRPVSRLPLVLAIFVGVVIGSGAVLLLSKGDQKVAPPAAPIPTLAALEPGSGSEETKEAPGPKVTSLAPVADLVAVASPDGGAATVSEGTDSQVQGVPNPKANIAVAPSPTGHSPGSTPAQGQPTEKVAPKTAGPKTAGPKTAGPKTAGPKTAGPKTAGPKTAGPKTAGPKTAGPKTAEPRKLVKLPAKVVKPAKKKVAVGGKCPRGMAHIRPRGAGDGYCIDRYEAPGRGRRPRVVSLSKARGACRARGARLCTTREWMKSCGWLFPYGRTFQAGRCNTESKATVAVGSKRTCRSRHGVYDLSGNVAEWVEEGVAMGGHYGTAQGHASCTARTRGGTATGYRCCADPAWDF